ncbi:hypothetical protein J2Z53_001444 [Clostridium moniliforme]|uniref:Uncharacterized protein n=1 Tax=Clostridium moniliforme TaxID=39489 RepID=A0ABS4F0V9_9CLOT|nr:phage minor capsid protein [Clostridium moniliforme]MBP1889861.1 hypothetical protein [Clostridium moniliforme]
MDKKNNPSKLKDILNKLNIKKIKDNAKKERDKSYDIRKIFEQMELDLISSMHRAFYFHKKQQEDEGFNWEQWQRTKLRELEKYRKRNKKIVESYNKPIEEAIEREIQGNFTNGQDNVEKLIDKVKVQFPDDIKETQTVKGYIANELGKESVPSKETNFFGINEKKLNALQEVVTNDLKKAQYSVLRKMDDVYRQTIFKTHMYLQSGTKTINQAIDMATKDFLDKGINSIVYKDGKRVNIASYAEMCLRTASQRATFLGEGKKRDEYGIHLVVVSAHSNTCKMCEPWQGKILIDDVFSHGTKEDGEYTLLSKAITEGLLHPNCRHTLVTYFPGITRMPVVPDGKEAIKLYEAEQKQRYYERQLRKWKRIEVGSVDAKNVNDASKRIKDIKIQLNKLLQDNRQLRRSHVREINSDIIEKVGRNDKLNSRRWLKANFSTQKKFDKHIEKHLSEYGYITPEEYLNISRDLLAASLSEDVEGFISKDGFTFKYRKSTNDFAVGRADGKISTVFKPKEGYDYWLEQIKEYKE